MYYRERRHICRSQKNLYYDFRDLEDLAFVSISIDT